jgi:hypothetical protein
MFRVPAKALAGSIQVRVRRPYLSRSQLAPGSIDPLLPSSTDVRGLGGRVGRVGTGGTCGHRGDVRVLGGRAETPRVGTGGTCGDLRTGPGRVGTAWSAPRFPPARYRDGPVRPRAGTTPPDPARPGPVRPGLVRTTCLNHIPRWCAEAARHAACQLATRCVRKLATPAAACRPLPCRSCHRDRIGLWPLQQAMSTATGCNGTATGRGGIVAADRLGHARAHADRLGHARVRMPPRVQCGRRSRVEWTRKPVDAAAFAGAWACRCRLARAWPLRSVRCG